MRSKHLDGKVITLHSVVFRCPRTGSRDGGKFGLIKHISRCGMEACHRGQTGTQQCSASAGPCGRTRAKARGAYEMDCQRCAFAIFSVVLSSRAACKRACHGLIDVTASESTHACPCASQTTDGHLGGTMCARSHHTHNRMRSERAHGL